MPLITQPFSEIYDVGDRPTLVATFHNRNGELADPSAITFSIMSPSGNITNQSEASATNSSTGVWEWQIPAAFDAPGTWRIRAVGTAGIQVAEETSVKVRKSAFL